VSRLTTGRPHVGSVSPLLEIRDRDRSRIERVGRSRSGTAERLAERARPLEKTAATIDMNSEGVYILLHRQPGGVLEFPRISPQQIEAVFVEPLAAFEDAVQIPRMGHSIEALEVLSSKVSEIRPPIVVA
jgi:hypothetical protein